MKYTDIAKAALALVLGVMTSTAFADPVLQEGFEGFGNDYAITNHADWAGGEDDASTVVPSNYTYTASSRPLPNPHTKVLKLNTEGGVLTNTLATAQSFAAANLYVDAMVKFVPSEELADLGTDQDIKVAVYAYVKEIQADPLITSTNLAIYHGLFDLEALVEPFAVTNTVTDITVDADAWHRLTIELAQGDGDNVQQAFRVLIDGVAVTNAAAYQDDWSTRINAELPPNNGPWFVSAACLGTLKTDVASLQFKGTGYIDDLVVTATAPSFEMGAEPFEVTQTIGAGGSSSDATSPISVEANTSTSLTYTANEFYRIATLTTNAQAIGAAVGQEDYTVELDSATAVDVTFAITGGYSAGNVAWFVANGWGEGDIVAGDFAKLEMLNVAATNAAAGGTITITDIVIDGTDVKVTVAIDRTMSLGDINGTICLYGWDELGDVPAKIGAASIAGTDPSLPDTEDFSHTFTFTGVTQKFFKAVIE